MGNGNWEPKAENRGHTKQTGSKRNKLGNGKAIKIIHNDKRDN